MSSCAPWDVPCLIREAASAIGNVAGGAAGTVSSDVTSALADLASLTGAAAAAGGGALDNLGNQIASELTQSGGAPPVVIQQSADAHALISQAIADGWSIVLSKTLIADISGPLSAGHLQLDAIEWKDLSFLGIGNVDLAASQFERYIESQGSHLYAWSVMEHTDFDALGITIKSYRLLLLHSQIQIGVGAIIAIVVAAFFAIVIWQYFTKGTSPALEELKKVWSDLVAGTVTPIAEAGLSVWIIGAAAAGAIALGFGVAGRKLGVKAPPPPKPPQLGFEAEVKKAGIGAKTRLL